MLGFSGQAKADVDPLVVEFENTPHLFSETNFLPGQNATGTARVTNNSGQPQRIATEAINYPDFPNPNNVPAGDLSRALSIIIREKGGSDLYGGSSPTGEKTLFDFYREGEIYLSDIITGATTEYEFEIAFPGEKEDEWQGATTTFDILIGFQGVEGKISPGGGGGGGGWLPPGLTINYEKPFYIGITTAKITWDTSYKSTSRVIYGTVAGVFDLNNLPNYGYAFSTAEKDTPADPNGVTSHEIWLTDLQPGTTYYYRAISHASPPTISQERSFTTLMPGGEVAGAATEREGKTGGLAQGGGGIIGGASTTGESGGEMPTPSPTGLAAGANILSAFGGIFSLWWVWIILVIIALLILIRILLRRRDENE